MAYLCLYIPPSQPGPKTTYSPSAFMESWRLPKISNQNKAVDQVAFGQGYRDEPLRSQDSSEFQTLEFQVPATKFDDQGDRISEQKTNRGRKREEF